MRIFALADLHLSLAHPKPMDIFGDEWRDHAARIAERWRATVGPEDLVLIAGDTSWALKLDEALPDLQWLADLPGVKVLIKGNHDYWWNSLSKVRRAAPPSLRFIQHDVLTVGDVALAGTRLWQFPECAWPLAAGLEAREEAAPAKGTAQAPDPEVIRRREFERLRGCLAQLPAEARARIALVHFPPLGAEGQPTKLTALLAEFRVDLCVFGHLHGLGRAAGGVPPPGADCVLGPTRYLLTSCDYLGFTPRLVWETGRG